MFVPPEVGVMLRALVTLNRAGNVRWISDHQKFYSMCCWRAFLFFHQMPLPLSLETRQTCKSLGPI